MVGGGTVAEIAAAIAENVRKVIRGKDELVRLAVAGLLTEGHLLIEDVPGLGKTTLARRFLEQARIRTGGFLPPGAGRGP